MRQKEDPSFKLSYESDGEMGKKQPSKSDQSSSKEQDENMFFNITQDSE